MADDGRAFFATFDALVPRDQDGKITDVYEYVAGRPQLISSGLGARDYTGGSSVISLFRPANTPASRRSATTAPTSTSRPSKRSSAEDHNGEFVKFYDARTGGGFDESPPLGPCAAADECHGVDSSPPPPAAIARGQPRPGGNVQPDQKKKAQATRGIARTSSKRHSTRHQPWLIGETARRGR